MLVVAWGLRSEVEVEFTDVNGVNEGAYVIGYKDGVLRRAGNI